MAARRSIALAGLVWAAAAVGAFAGAARGLTFAGGSAWVASVSVEPGESAVPRAFVEGLRAAILAEAALYGAAGQPVVLNIELDKVHLKNPVQALLIGDNDLAAGRVEVVDQASGRNLGAFAVKVDAQRHRGASIAMAVVGAFDPTGYVDVAATAAGAGASVANPSATEAHLGANFAVEALRRTFGDARARAVHAAGR